MSGCERSREHCLKGSAGVNGEVVNRLMGIFNEHLFPGDAVEGIHSAVMIESMAFKAFIFVASDAGRGVGFNIEIVVDKFGLRVAGEFRVFGGGVEHSAIMGSMVGPAISGCKSVWGRDGI